MGGDLTTGPGAAPESASKLGLDVSEDTWAVAAARIHDQIAPAIRDDPQITLATVRQVQFAEQLGLNVSKDTVRVASARIGDALDQRNQEALAVLNLKPGDRVLKRETVEFEGNVHVFSNEYVVSSIGVNRRVYFKGIGCPGAWPTQIEKLGPSTMLKSTLRLAEIRRHGSGERSHAGGRGSGVTLIPGRENLTQVANAVCKPLGNAALR